MAQFFEQISDRHRDFIEAQKIFFVATGTANGRINLSPKGMDALRVLTPNRIAWLNLTGSGNESAAHVRIDPRMTIMMCAFDGAPMILRLFGRARAIHCGEEGWSGMAAHFPPLPGARQIFDVVIDSVQISCGFGVPLYDYAADRDTLRAWAEQKGEVGVRRYWAEKNTRSIDGLDTGIPVADD